MLLGATGFGEVVGLHSGAFGTLLEASWFTSQQVSRLLQA